jgi:hypothetical protein
MLQEVRDSFWNDVTIALKDVRLPAWFESKVSGCQPVVVDERK